MCKGDSIKNDSCEAEKNWRRLSKNNVTCEQEPVARESTKEMTIPNMGKMGVINTVMLLLYFSTLISIFYNDFPFSFYRIWWVFDNFTVRGNENKSDSLFICALDVWKQPLRAVPWKWLFLNPENSGRDNSIFFNIPKMLFWRSYLFAKFLVKSLKNTIGEVHF